MAVQTALDKALVQWPFLHDTSLIAAITAVFVPAGHLAAGTDTAKAAAQAAAAGALDMTLLQPWLYNNVLLLNSQLFIPVLDKVSPPEGWLHNSASHTVVLVFGCTVMCCSSFKNCRLRLWLCDVENSISLAASRCSMGR